MFFSRIAAATLALILLSAPAWAEIVHVNGDKARFRAGPGTNYKVLWEAGKYTPLEYLAKYKDWYVVRDYQGDVGWLHEQSVGKGKAAIVIVKKASVRKGPGQNHPTIFSVEERYLFKVIDEKKEWAKVVDKEGDEGWLLKESLWISR